MIINFSGVFVFVFILNIFNFEFYNVCVVMCDDELWFVVIDVCMVLGLLNLSEVMWLFDSDE